MCMFFNWKAEYLIKRNVFASYDTFPVYVRIWKAESFSCGSLKGFNYPGCEISYGSDRDFDKIYPCSFTFVM